MYVTKVQLENIRSIKKFEMNFPKPAGWHVIIGDNGSGKTSVLRAIGFGLIGEFYTSNRRVDILTFLMQNAPFCGIRLNLTINKKYDTDLDENRDEREIDIIVVNTIAIKRLGDKVVINGISREEQFANYQGIAMNSVIKSSPPEFQYDKQGIALKGWFSIGFGPFRRFFGGGERNENVNPLFKISPRIEAHKSLFGEHIALTEALSWIRELDYERLKEMEISQVQEPGSKSVYDNLKIFINNSDLLPHGIKLEGVERSGIVFLDGNKNKIDILELSDGYRSILSLTFELLRQMIVVYGSEAVFKEINKGNMVIDLPGVVMIDEVDAHLHPSWQAQIGFWFTKFFPSMQFIVSTHSPLVCRACENGSIWRLARPGSETESGEITGVDRDRLIFGNVLDAYGTELFGRSVDQSEKSLLLQKEIADLNKKSFKGTISNEEKARMFELKKILPTAE